MQFFEDSTTAAHYLKKAIPLMVDREIPTNPYNFALWYSHVKGADSQLSNRLMTEFPSAGAYERQKGERLFFEYFVKGFFPENEEVQDALATLLSHLFVTVNKTAKGTRKFSESVHEALSKVQITNNPEDIRKTLSGLIKETNAIEKLTNDFQSELQSAKQEVELLKEKLVKTEKNALIDELTNVGNRRAFDIEIKKSLSDQSVPTCLVLMDLDHFKSCNDTYGHLMGDNILESMGRILSKFQNDYVSIFRYGGEEFAMIVNDELECASDLAESVREKVEALRIRHRKTDSVIDSVTISAGVALAIENEDVKSLTERADRALYDAKEQGRNQVVIEKT